MKAFVAIALLLAAGILSGCQSPPAPLPEVYNVQVRLADSLRDGSGIYPGVDIFVKGITEWEQKQDWSQRPDVDDFARYRGPIDPSEGFSVLQLGANQSKEKVLTANDPAWRGWAGRGATELVIVTNFPRTKPNQSGPDRRLLIIPLSREQYPDNTLRIEVTKEGLDLQTPPRGPVH